MDYELDTASIKRSLDALADRHERIARALAQVGYPEERRRDHSFETLARIVVGQQVSVAAATSINKKLVDALEGRLTATAVLDASEELLRSAGLSRQKVNYIQSLATAEATGALVLDGLPELSDEDAVAVITNIKGFGEWSAHMYLMFSLGRPDIWPVGDLAVREGFKRIQGLEERPSAGKLKPMGDDFRPYRSALAMLCWRFCTAEPL
ncbi:3-methyladenine DNA glycosylase/8-oxoguanine DNA glycosylase [gamma proteobacterium HIMB55]|nr:3-methyladenine DNA glycosylase/8-oxoguanine DNA glycosylase [gamma proteobacterium HIMB55]